MKERLHVNLMGGWIITDVIYESLDPLTGMYHDTIRNATTYEVCEGHVFRDIMHLAKKRFAHEETILVPIAVSCISV